MACDYDSVKTKGGIIHIQLPMKQTYEGSAVSWFGFITALLSLSHAATIVLSVLFTNDQDDHDPIFGPSRLHYYANQPFVIATAVCLLLQLLAGVSIWVGSFKGRTKTVYYGSLLGLLAVFGLGVYLVNMALEFNFGTRSFPKKTDFYPQLMPLYYVLFSTAGSTFLFMLPMLLYSFGTHLKPYLSQTQLRTKKSDPQGWFLSLFLVHALAQVVLIINFYQLSDAQNKVNFTNDNVTDIIISYYGVALVVELVAAVVLMKNSLRPWLSKTQSVWIGAVMGMFMGGSFVSEAITAAKVFVEISVGGDLLCAYKDCDSLNLFKWQIMGFAILNLIAVVLAAPFLKLLATLPERGDLPRDTLLTTEEGIEARQ